MTTTPLSLLRGSTGIMPQVQLATPLAQQGYGSLGAAGQLRQKLLGGAGATGTSAGLNPIIQDMKLTAGRLDVTRGRCWLRAPAGAAPRP
jgi:hypothetical protein